MSACLPADWNRPQAQHTYISSSNKGLGLQVGLFLG